ncbi:oxidoreductase [Paenibacillus agaridevorans]|uniref:Oxidoreductase n=1 Tax=Paenibacillus agaridevorans TaxID=171404 RepID=A0A2R5ERT9_9BACL|nr:Gfo/Idh/MocA family oxidoreductase [Paenibacillus agaridevorans]GBG09416.1 oxidoreductase [Paenibacillus agaridevorans]
MFKQVRFAIVGCGVIADIHAQGINQLEETVLSAVCDADEEKGRAFADKFGAKYYASYEEMLADPDIEVVNICTPSGMHPEHTMLAARAGKHIICEKPLAIKLDDLLHMIRVCKEENVKLATVFPRRMAPAAQYVKQLLGEGKLGKLTLCDAYVKIYRSQQYYDSAGWRGTWAVDGGGAMMNQGIHIVDLLQWFAGPVRTIYGKACALQRSIEVEDTAVSALTFEGGGLGVMVMTTTSNPELGQRIELHGERGTLVYEDDQIKQLLIDGEAVELPAFEPFAVLPDGHRIQIRDMAYAVREGREPIVTGEDGIHALQMILGTYESSRIGKEIDLSMTADW